MKIFANAKEKDAVSIPIAKQGYIHFPIIIFPHQLLNIIKCYFQWWSQNINFVKNWVTDLNHSIFDKMIKFFPSLKILKTSTFLVLFAVLVLTPCGIKQSVKQLFNIENLTSNFSKSGASCQYVQTSNTKVSKQIAFKKQTLSDSAVKFPEEKLFFTVGTTRFRKARSVPLYILYEQLRCSLV